MILLTDKESELAVGVCAQRNMPLLERDEITNIEFTNRERRAQNKAQLKKVYELLKKDTDDFFFAPSDEFIKELAGLKEG